MKKLYFIIIPVSMFFIILLTSILTSTYDKSLYLQQFKANNTYENSMIIDRNISPEIIADEVIGYLKNDFNNLNKNGHYTNEEIIHMEDVKNLFIISKYLIIIFSVLAVFLSILYVRNTKDLSGFLKKFIKSYVIASIVIFILLAIAFLNFNESFTTFHELLFTNDYWLLDESTSIIINIMPLEFFIAHTINIGKLFFIISLALIILIILISQFIKRRNLRNNL